MKKFTCLIDSEFFEKASRGDPKVAERKWNQWIKKHPNATNEQKYRKILEITAVVGKTTPLNYLHPDPLRFFKVGDDTRDHMNFVTEILGCDLPEGSKQIGANLPKPNKQITHLAVLTEFTIPSDSYHFRIIRLLTNDASKRNLSVSLHEITGKGLFDEVKKLCVNFHPGAIVMLRITPSPEVVSLLSERSIPCVLIHADRQKYSPPILSNIVPNNEKIKRELTAWLENLYPSEVDPIVIISMPEEETPELFPEIGGVTRSIRNARRQTILETLSRWNTVIYEVEDYSFRQALPIYQKHPYAPVYIALSDDIAVALKHLILSNPRTKEIQQNVLGFDDSPLANREQISSFDQHLKETVNYAIDKICEVTSETEQKCYPDFEELLIDITLTSRV